MSDEKWDIEHGFADPPAAPLAAGDEVVTDTDRAGVRDLVVLSEEWTANELEAMAGIFAAGRVAGYAAGYRAGEAAMRSRSVRRTHEFAKHTSDRERLELIDDIADALCDLPILGPEDK